MTWEWLEPWRAAFAAERPLRVIVVRDAGEPVAILPLIVYSYRRRKLATRTLRLLGNGLSDRLDILVHPQRPGAAQALGAALASLRGEWERLELSDLDLGSGTGARLQTALRAAGLPVARRSTARCPCVPLSGDFETFYATHVSKRSQTKDRAKLRKFAAMSGFRFRPVQQPAECRELLERIFSLQEAASYHGQPRQRPFDGARARAFFRDAVSRLSAQGWLLLNAADADDGLIAYEFGFRYHNRYLDYYGGYDPQYRKLSPGRMLMLDLIERLFAQGVSELDFLRGAEDWKSDWATDVRENEQLLVSNPGIGSRLRWWLQRL